jgi:hypothetical protein
MKKQHFIISIILNSLIIVFDLFALLATAGVFPFAQGMNVSDMFQYFTIDSNIVLLLSSLLLLIVEVKSFLKRTPLPKAAVLFKFVGTVGVMLTFLVAYCVLLPSTKDGSFVFGWSGFLWMHTVCPLLALISFVFFEFEPKLKVWWSFLGLSEVGLYGVLILPMMAAKVITGPNYPFLQHLDDGLVTTGVVLGMAVGTFLVSLLILLFRSLFGRQVKPVEKTDEEEEDSSSSGSDKPVKILHVVPGKDPEQTDGTASATGVPSTARVYHISRHISGKWQVKLASGGKAIKLFNTQEEAIAFAKDLVKTQGGSIRVHSLLGKLRKE